MVKNSSFDFGKKSKNTKSTNCTFALHLSFVHVETVKLQHGKNKQYVNSTTAYVNINETPNEYLCHQSNPIRVFGSMCRFKLRNIVSLGHNT